ncbi:hypothetical protein PR048_023066 [Dryococelus australis]|uniref:Uncharacterized protein n=1 Tax=Dryococelus australis TaxID=614101 RepID=A0ABQ9GT12_9NEOP|nr:hypothetical protein PR048_023066 [Dryococelus australis]
MEVSEVSMEQRRNARDPRENPPINGIVQHDSHMRKSGVTRPGIEPRSSWLFTVKRALLKALLKIYLSARCVFFRRLLPPEVDRRVCDCEVETGMQDHNKNHGQVGHLILASRDRRALKKVVREHCMSLCDTITREFRCAINCADSTTTVRQLLRGMGFKAQVPAHNRRIYHVNSPRSDVLERRLRTRPQTPALLTSLARSLQEKWSAVPWRLSSTNHGQSTSQQLLEASASFYNPQLGLISKRKLHDSFALVPGYSLYLCTESCARCDFYPGSSHVLQMFTSAVATFLLPQLTTPFTRNPASHPLSHSNSKLPSRRGRGGVVVGLLASHQGEPGSTAGGVAPAFSHVMGIVPDDAASRQVFSGISRFSCPCIPVLLHTQPRFTLIGSQDLDVKSRRNHFTHSFQYNSDA